MPIVQMDQLLINQIAAGEVVTRPASAVKELIENSLDASPTEIKIDIQNAGLQLIKIQDNGTGIAKQDLPLAISAHATSKITTLEQLSEVNSFGFRGEALASIVSVAEVNISSKAEGCDDAWSLQSKPSLDAPTISPAAHPQGTTVSVKNLFANIPVRRRFLSSERAEFNRILAVVQQFILQHQHVAFSLTHNKRNIISVPANTDESTLVQRFMPILGEDFNQQALSFSVQRAGMTLSGYIARPQVSSAGQTHQFSYVNKRYVRDKLIIKAMKSAYADLQYQDRQPKYIVHLELDPKQVDVNVHPSKHEVRFRQSKLVYEFIYSTIKSILLEATSVGSIQQSQLDHANKFITNDMPAKTCDHFDAGAKPASFSKQAAAKSDIYNAANYASQSSLQLNDSGTETMLDSSVAFATETKSTSKPVVIDNIPGKADLFSDNNFPKPWVDKATDEVTDNLATDSLGYAIGQLHDTFIIAQSAVGMILVDMHAAHERVIYEKMKTQYDAGDIISQKLLLGVDIGLSILEQENLSAIEDSLRKIGWDFSLDNNSHNLTINAVPALLADIDFEPWLRELLDESNSQIINQKHQQRIYHLLGNMACRAAIKTNRHLTIAEMNTLLRQIEKTPYSSYCNHGRPTWRLFTLTELDRFFVRGQ